MKEKPHDYGNRFGIPFTRDEMLRAHAQVMPLAEAEEMVRGIYDPDPQDAGVTLMDGSLLLLALLSDDLRERVLRYRPGCAELLGQVEPDRERFLAGWRAEGRK